MATINSRAEFFVVFQSRPLSISCGQIETTALSEKGFFLLLFGHGLFLLTWVFFSLFSQ